VSKVIFSKKFAELLVH